MGISAVGWAVTTMVILGLLGIDLLLATAAGWGPNQADIGSVRFGVEPVQAVMVGPIQGVLTSMSGFGCHAGGGGSIRLRKHVSMALITSLKRSGSAGLTM